jgi:hypothetical protein
MHTHETMTESWNHIFFSKDAKADARSLFSQFDTLSEQLDRQHLPVNIAVSLKLAGINSWKGTFNFPTTSSLYLRLLSLVAAVPKRHWLYYHMLPVLSAAKPAVSAQSLFHIREYVSICMQMSRPNTIAVMKELKGQSYLCLPVVLMRSRQGRLVAL